MNHEIFKNTQELMENIIGVTSYLRGQILKSGGDPERETLNFVPTLSGDSYYVDSTKTRGVCVALSWTPFVWTP